MCDPEKNQQTGANEEPALMQDLDEALNAGNSTAARILLQAMKSVEKADYSAFSTVCPRTVILEPVIVAQDPYL